jgi:hypothetical protein
MPSGIQPGGSWIRLGNGDAAVAGAATSTASAAATIRARDRRSIVVLPWWVSAATRRIVAGTGKARLDVVSLKGTTPASVRFSRSSRRASDRPDG